jgi:hypothetical protein
LIGGAYSGFADAKAHAQNSKLLRLFERRRKIL